MNVAVIVPCLTIDPLTVRCVRACRAAAEDARLIVLTDDDDGREQISEVAEIIVTGPMTIGAKRNLGASRTDAELLAFIDSDAYPSRGWIDSARRFLDAHPHFAAVGGPNVSPPGESSSQRYVGAANLSYLVGGWWAFRRDPMARAREVEALPSCNLIVRAGDYAAVGGMNPDLFTAEDTDFCARFVASGRRIHFTPDVLVFHQNRNLRSFAIQRFTFGVAMVPLLRSGKRPSTAYTVVSAAVVAFVLLLASAPLGIVSRRWARAWSAVVTAYLAIVAVEATRHADDLSDVPGTSLALVVGNLAPGVGMALKAVRAVPDLRGIYRNDR